MTWCHVIMNAVTFLSSDYNQDVSLSSRIDRVTVVNGRCAGRLKSFEDWWFPVKLFAVTIMTTAPFLRPTDKYLHSVQAHDSHQARVSCLGVVNATMPVEFTGRFVFGAVSLFTEPLSERRHLHRVVREEWLLVRLQTRKQRKKLRW